MTRLKKEKLKEPKKEIPIHILPIQSTYEKELHELYNSMKVWDSIIIAPNVQFTKGSPFGSGFKPPCFIDIIVKKKYVDTKGTEKEFVYRKLQNFGSEDQYLKTIEVLSLPQMPILMKTMDLLNKEIKEFNDSIRIEKEQKKKAKDSHTNENQTE